MLHNCTLMVDTVGMRNEFSTKPNPTLDEKRKAALAFLGDKWVLHSKHAPKNKTRNAVSARYFLGV